MNSVLILRDVKKLRGNIFPYMNPKFDTLPSMTVSAYLNIAALSHLYVTLHIGELKKVEFFIDLHFIKIEAKFVWTSDL